MLIFEHSIVKFIMMPIVIVAISSTYTKMYSLYVVSRYSSIQAWRERLTGRFLLLACVVSLLLLGMAWILMGIQASGYSLLIGVFQMYLQQFVLVYLLCEIYEFVHKYCNSLISISLTYLAFVMMKGEYFIVYLMLLIALVCANYIVYRRKDF